MAKAAKKNPKPKTPKPLPKGTKIWYRNNPNAAGRHVVQAGIINSAIQWDDPVRRGYNVNQMDVMTGVVYAAMDLPCEVDVRPRTDEGYLELLQICLWRRLHEATSQLARLCTVIGAIADDMLVQGQVQKGAKKGRKKK